LCVAGLPTDRFYFEGFLPARSSARRERLNALAAVPGSLIFYEAAGRLAETLADLALELGPRPAAVARELTKLHEEVRRGALDKLAAEYAAEDPPRGEIVIVVGAPEERPAVSEAGLDREIAEQLATLSVKDAAAAVAAKHGLPRRLVYARALTLAGASERTERKREAHIYGLRAESIAALLLRLKGYTILARRFVVSGGEIDLVARRGGSIAFVEVKARADLEVAAIAISAAKRRRIARAARVWLTRNPWAAGLTLRGDAVFIARGRLPRHEPDAYRLMVD
jgi:Holliday junction resolvase-like predicted endonuclease